MTIITTERLALRPLEMGDADDLVRGLNNFNVSHWTARVPYPYSAADASAFIESCRSDRPGTLSLAITLDGRLIGDISYVRSDDGISAELGYWLTELEWAKGYGKEAAHAMTRHAFGEGRHDLLIAGYFRGNEGSRRILEGLGFEPTGELMQFSMASNANLPSVRLALSKGRWHQIEGRRR